MLAVELHGYLVIILLSKANCNIYSFIFLSAEFVDSEVLHSHSGPQGEHYPRLLADGVADEHPNDHHAYQNIRLHQSKDIFYVIKDRSCWPKH